LGEELVLQVLDSIDCSELALLCADKQYFIKKIEFKLFTKFKGELRQESINQIFKVPTIKLFNCDFEGSEEQVREAI